MMKDPIERPPVFTDLRAHLQDQPPPITKETFLGDGIVLHNTLTQDECKAFIGLSEQKGYQDASDYCFMYRDRWNDRFMSDDKELAAFLWKRVKQFVPTRVHDLGREWELEDINTRFRFCKYIGGEGHYFGAHTDGMYVVDSDHRSLLTCMWYLNGVDEFEGGLTNFIEHGTQRLKYSVQPKPGLCVIFPQANLSFYHEGTQVTSGLKYILRTDLMFHAVK